MWGLRPSRGFNSISNKMLVVLVAVAVLPAVTVALFALQQGTESLADQALKLLVDKALTDARRTEALLHDAQEDLTEITRLGIVRSTFETLRRPVTQGKVEGLTPRQMEAMGEQSLPWLTLKLHGYLERIPAATSLLVLSQQEAWLVPVLRLQRDQEEIKADRLFRFTEQGVPEALPEPEVDALTTSLQRALQEELSRHPHSSSHEATIDTEEGAQDLFVVAVRDRYDRVVGKILVTLSWPQLLRELCTDVSAEDPLEPTPVRVTLYNPRLDLLENSHVDEPVAVPLPLAQDARAGRAGAVLTSAQRIVSFAPMSHPAQPGGFSVLAFERPTSQEFVDVARFRYVFSAVLAAALMLALGLGTYLSRRMTRPLRALRDGARLIGSGHLDQRLEVGTGDEVEDLAEAFNRMAGQLQSLYQGMEDTITDRTRQLSDALTGLRDAHQKIVESEARYSDIVENAFDLIQVTDQEGRIQSVNRRQAQLLGITPDDLQGRAFLDFVAEDRRAATDKAFQGVLEGNTLNAFSTDLALEDGRRVPVEVSATPMVRKDQVVGVHAILRDVSERKQIEAQLIRAERLSSVGALAAGVAHEINNPLGIITMFAQRTLEKAREGKVDADKLEKIVSQARRVATITQGLLDFSRAGPTEFRPITLPAIIEETVSLVGERARQNQVEIQVLVDEGLPTVLGSTQQVGQVILNLLLNALQALAGPGRIQVRAESIEHSHLAQGGPAVRVSVSDTGPGIHESVLPHLFEPFFTTKDPGQGTGLGLSVSYGILKEHHGILTASNLPQGGACLAFDLPIQPQPVKE